MLSCRLPTKRALPCLPLCLPQGNTGTGNQGQGNTGTNNQGQGNTGTGNQGQGNTGTNNQGQGNTGTDNQGQGNTGTGNQVRCSFGGAAGSGSRRGRECGCTVRVQLAGHREQGSAAMLCCRTGTARGWQAALRLLSSVPALINCSCLNFATGPGQCRRVQPGRWQHGRRQPGERPLGAGLGVAERSRRGRDAQANSMKRWEPLSL